jgi:MoaA/NifB/PqqE/SkfB family radical SAM enzyme
VRALAFARAVLQNRLGAVPQPAWCTYLVTFRCNARCGMCDSWRLKPGRELTVDEVAAVFARLGRLDVVRLSGGEPFLREDFLPLAEAVMRAAAPLVLHITTNGSFPERIARFVERFSAPSRLSVMVSVDGLPDEQLRSRGAEVGFEGVLDSVTRLATFRRTHGVTVSVNHTVISPQSLADHEPLRRRFLALGVDVQSVLAYADSAMYGLKLRGKKASHLIVPRGYPLHPALAGVDAVGFVERELASVDQIGHPFLRWGKRYYLRGLLARLRHEEAPRPHPRCVALRSHVRLLPDGSVPVCQFNTETVGNLREQSLAEVWQGEAARAARRWVDDCPGCWAECEVMPSAIYTADLLGRRWRAA